MMPHITSNRHISQVFSIYAAGSRRRPPVAVPGFDTRKEGRLTAFAATEGPARACLPGSLLGTAAFIDLQKTCSHYNIRRLDAFGCH